MELVAMCTGLGLCGAGDVDLNGLCREMNDAVDKEPANNEALMQEIFEVGRRNKILNPSKMRNTYGKLMYLMQDAQNMTVAKSLGFSLHKDIVLVGDFIKERGAEDMLRDPALPLAVSHVTEFDRRTGERRTRKDVKEQVEAKQAAKKDIVSRYAGYSIAGAGGGGSKAPQPLTAAEVERVVDSLADAYDVVESNAAPVERMLAFLEENFDPNKPEKNFGLELSGGGGGGYSSPFNKYGAGMGSFGFGRGSDSNGSGGGAKLSHSHSTQYTFVWQTLRLWIDVQRNMHLLWLSADEDLLSTSSCYQLWNTGQGLNRVQSCPKVGSLMGRLLSGAQKSAGAPWVGLSVVHLGDRDVPNALVFIDKYTQVPRILTPIVDFVDGVDGLWADEKIRPYIEVQFGDARSLKMKVLCDYFKHGFDGSGDDGGSCIDGRLTSSWNWTSRIAKKSYYHSFMLNGFQGFDGDWK